MFPEIECPVFDSEVAQTRGELGEGQLAVYILQCNDASFYVGQTSNLRKRLNYHNSQNGAVWIKKRLPAKLVFFFVCNKRHALFLKKKLKGWRREKKEKLIRREWSLDYFKSSH
ncbi:MAG: GIY-YIG nuclease family protein [Patescibacteria group bacterium]